MLAQNKKAVDEPHSCRSVTTLLNASVKSVVINVSNYIEKLSILPPNLKDRLLQLMSKRGLLTDSNLSKVVHERLQVLDLSESEVSDVGLRCLRKCPNLQKIDLNSAKVSRTNITSAGVTTLAGSCPNLQVVYLRRCLNITDDAVISLSRHCTKLRYLNLGGCTQITDVSLQALGQNTSFLKSIDISKTSITDSGVYSLVSGSSCSSLKEIHINGCVALTDEAVEAVIMYCPQISLLIFHGCPKMTEQSRLALDELSMNQNSKMKQVTWTVY